jgi:hypothetical protein
MIEISEGKITMFVGRALKALQLGAAEGIMRFSLDFTQPLISRV